MRQNRVETATPPWPESRTTLLQWASETGAHGMPAPQELERCGWHRLAEHPLFQGTWLMETPEGAPAPSSLRARTATAVAEGRPRLG